MKHKQQSVPSKNLTFLESEELSSKPNTMCCIWIKTASATVYAYRFHSWILPPKSQFLTAKNVCYHSLAKHPKTEIYHSCSFCWQTVLCLTYPIFTSIQLIFWMPQIPKGVWEVKKKKQKTTNPPTFPFSSFILLEKLSIHSFATIPRERTERSLGLTVTNS